MSDRCLRWPANSVRLCQLTRGHAGKCLPLPKFPFRDISETNPPYVRGAA